MHKEQRRERRRKRGEKHKELRKKKLHTAREKQKGQLFKKAGDAPATRKVGLGPPQGAALLRELPAPPALPQGGAIFSRAFVLG